MKTIACLLFVALTASAAHGQTPVPTPAPVVPTVPTPIAEGHLITPLNPILAAGLYAPQFVAFVGVQAPELGVIYIVDVTVQATKQAYTASCLLNPPIAPNTFSICMLPISMQLGETLPANQVMNAKVYLSLTGPSGLPIIIKVN